MSRGIKAIYNSKGLTLIEVIAVLAILAGIASILLRNFAPQLKKSKVRQAQILISRLSESVESFYLDCSYYPSNSEGFEALVLAPAKCESWGPDPYLRNGKIPKDPWGNDFIYKHDDATGRYEIISLGEGGIEGGENFQSDISSKEI